MTYLRAVSDSIPSAKALQEQLFSTESYTTPSFGFTFVPNEQEAPATEESVYNMSLKTLHAKSCHLCASKPTLPGMIFIPSGHKSRPVTTSVSNQQNSLLPQTPQAPRSFDFFESGFNWNAQSIQPSHHTLSSTYSAPSHVCGKCWSHKIINISLTSKLNNSIQEASFVDHTCHFIHENGHTIGSFVYTLLLPTPSTGTSACARISSFLHGQSTVTANQIAELWYNHTSSYTKLVGKGVQCTGYNIPSYADIEGASSPNMDFDSTGSQACLDNWIPQKAIQTLDEEGKHISQHKFGFEGVVWNWESIRSFSPPNIQSTLQHDAPFIWTS